MISKDILQTDFLDILFENRNKDYGAYALRKTYPYRLKWALALSLGLVLLLLFAHTRKNNNNMEPITQEMPDVFIRTVELPKAQILPAATKNRAPATAQLHSTRVEIIPDAGLKKIEMPLVSEAQTDGEIGPSLGGSAAILSSAASGGSIGSQNGTGNTVPLSYSDAQFPGGARAFANFLAKYLVTPSDLETGEKRKVLVRFMVDVDGSISKMEIVQSDGEAYNKEVKRVLSKMPRWIPAMQNGIKQPSWFMQPVTFIGVE